MREFVTPLAVLVSMAFSLDFSHAQPPKPPGLATANFKVTRTGRFRSAGEDAAFPKRGARGVTFGATVLMGKARRDGYLDLARSSDGRRLWTRRGTDDGNVEINLFEVKGEVPWPAGARLQLVDGFTTPAPDADRDGGLGRASFMRGDQLWERHFEAWIVLPEEGMILRPADQVRYPLVPAASKPQPATLTGAQWVVFAPRCPETKSACVYYGSPAQACARRRAAGGVNDELLTFPWKCDSLPAR